MGQYRILPVWEQYAIDYQEMAKIPEIQKKARIGRTKREVGAAP
jgi:hypothetical protein